MGAVAPYTSIPNTPHKFIWHFMQPQKWLWLGVFISGACMAVAEGAQNYFLTYLIDAIQEVEGRSAESVKAVLWSFVPFVSVYILVRFFHFLESTFASPAGPSFRNNIRMEMFEYIQKHSVGFMNNTFSGQIAQKIMDAQGGGVMVLFGINDIVFTLLIAITTLVFLMLIHPFIALYGAVWLVAYVYIAWLIVTVVRKKAYTVAKVRTYLSGQAVDILSNFTTMKVFASERHEKSRYGMASLNERQESIERNILHRNARVIKHILHTLLLVGIFLTSWYCWQHKMIELSGFIVAITYSVTWISHINRVAEQFQNLFEEWARIQAALDKILHPHDIVDSKEVDALESPEGAIDIHKVDFSYGREQMFESFSLSIPAGQKVALVGKSGAGKTTLVNLVLRLFDLDQGKITIDGQDIAELEQSELRKHIGVILQDTSLFHRSLMENIRYGRPEATDEEVIEASKKAYAHEFIKSLKEGYDTFVGERGVKLSGGQRQRIAIARAILKDAPILLLDEATSALDSESEQYIQASLEGVMEGKTVVAIAHRLSTISHMDRIVVLDKGRIVEDGTHEELLEQGGIYAKLWSMQSGGFIA